MARRPVFAADTPATALADWIATAIREAFTGPRVLPILRRPPAEPQAPLPMLFEGLPDQRRGEPAVVLPKPELAPEPARQPPPAGMPLHEVMAAHFAGVIAPKSELALKRERRKEERAAAAKAARAAEAATSAPEPVAPPTARGPSPEEVAYVQAAILDILPKGWPSYAKQVLSIRKDRGARICRLRLFDDEIGELTLSGSPGGHGYAWKVGQKDKRAFQFDEQAWAWVRVDEDV